MADYIAWSDIRKHIDKFVVGGPDNTIVTAGIEIAEDRFNNALRERYDVPFVEADEPQAFALAQRICAMWAGAYYIVNARQAEGNEEPATWYADRLAAWADDIFEVFLEGEPPSDTPASGLSFSELPQDGYDDLTETEQENLEPFFRRSHVRTGKDTHW